MSFIRSTKINCSVYIFYFFFIKYDCDGNIESEIIYNTRTLIGQ